MFPDLDIAAKFAREAREARATVRALELRAGQATDEDGRYWLARVSALERLIPAAQHAITTGEVEQLRAAVAAVDEVLPPVCREGDHAQLVQC